MIAGKNFGFLIWGVRNGFDKNILSSGVPEEIADQAINDSMRQVCNNVIEQFYSIEKTTNYTVISIFNPNFKDHVNRKAYVAISIFAQRGIEFVGDVLGVLTSAMEWYSHKQGAAMVNMMSVEQMAAQFSGITAVSKSANGNITSDKFGYWVYSQPSEIVNLFKAPAIEGYKKIIFHNGTNPNVAELPNYNLVTSFPRVATTQMQGYDPARFTVYINNQLQNRQNSFVFSAETVTGDIIRIVDNTSGKQKEYQVPYGGLSLNCKNVFANSLGTGPESPGRKDESPSNITRVVIIASACIVSALCGWFLFQEDQQQPRQPTPSASTTLSLKDSVISGIPFSRFDKFPCFYKYDAIDSGWQKANMKAPNQKIETNPKWNNVSDESEIAWLQDLTGNTFPMKVELKKMAENIKDTDPPKQEEEPPSRKPKVTDAECNQWKAQLVNLQNNRKKLLENPTKNSAKLNVLDTQISDLKDKIANCK